MFIIHWTKQNIEILNKLQIQVTKHIWITKNTQT